MNNEQMRPLLEAWFRDTDPTPPDTRRTAVKIMARVPQTRQRGRWWPLPAFHQRAQTPTATDTTDHRPSPTPATNDPLYWFGHAYLVAQIDFMHGETPSRIHATCTLPQAEDARFPRDAFEVVGPIPPGELDLEQVRRHAMRDASASSLEELRELGQAQGGRGLDDPGAARRTGREDGRGDEQGEENEAGAHDEDSG